MAGNTQVVYQNRINERDRNAQSPSVVKEQKKHFYDYTLLFAVIFMFAAGLLLIFSSSQYTAMIEKGSATYYFKRQAMIGGGGLVAAILISKFNYRIFKKGIWPLLIFFGTIGLLGATLILGLAAKGKTRWLSFFGASFQPTEVAKIGVIMTVAFLIELMGKGVNRTRNFWLVFAAGILPGFMVFSQNISSGFIIIFIAAVMLFVASEKHGLFGACLGIGAAGLIAAKPLIRLVIEKTGYTERPSQYWLRRILAWALPDVYTADAYQTQQGLYAIGSGGITGRGLGESIQKFGKIPEVQNDMIFTVICEEFGFIGALTLIILYGLIIYRIYIIAKNAIDMYGSMICIGVMAHLSIQVILNIAVVTGVIPNTGVTLPFISYGGSAAAFTMIEVGLVLSVSNRIPVSD
ncbi:MAG: FtsW/RodA/SpoVE family cell cycle protein [Lachnospiraceae bacterium]|nr:FtsW/RodA/SpoVE family cell cycle protein [Lachnospiraceae bacterium]